MASHACHDASRRRLGAATIAAHRGTPVLFVHGRWLHATSWSPWVEVIDHHGWREIADTSLARSQKNGL
jgi:hypothetical protein